MATSNNEKADTLNKFFSTVITRENMGGMPDQEEREIQQQLTEVKLTHEVVL